MNALRDPAAYAASDAILLRILDACLREDLCGIVSRATRAPPPGEHGDWLRVDHLPGGALFLPVRATRFMQLWRVREPRWLWRANTGATVLEGDADRLLQHLSAGQDVETRALFDRYATEARTAVAHRLLCQAAASAGVPALNSVLDDPDWGRRLLGIDQLAAYADHPFYPTARAKSGFDADALRRYAPEWAPCFALRWIAVPRDAVSLLGPPPPEFPAPAAVGLPASLSATHALLPVHPLTWDRIESVALPLGSHRAPEAALEVVPTLSVRTVCAVADPTFHVKLPLRMCTLGARNLRLVKPDTLRDGHTMERILRAIVEDDPALRGWVTHVDESHGGHVGADPALSYLVRRYPAELRDETPVPVAALAAPACDGAPFALQLARRYHAGDMLGWAAAHARLLLRVHLRLWLRYGIALESNQQNAVLLYRDGAPPRLMMKDNDAARLDPAILLAARPDLAGLVDGLRDPRIAAADEAALAAMFCTITLQLCLAAPFDAIATAGLAPRDRLFALLRGEMDAALAGLVADGIDTAPARRHLLEPPTLPVKYLLTAGSLLPKTRTGAADINKFYGHTAPNFLRSGNHDA